MADRTEQQAAMSAAAHERPDEGHAEELRPGWSRARPEHIPRPTYWPAVVGLGITFALWGFLTIWIVGIVGLFLLGIGLAGWIGEWQHEH